MYIKSCKISQYVPYKSYKTKREFNQLKMLRNVHINGNEILDAIIGHIPYMNLDISYQINSNWYKFKFINKIGNNFVFEQYTMSPPEKGGFIQTIRYVYIELA